MPLAQLAPSGECEELLHELRELLRVFHDSLDPDRRLLLEQFQLTDFARKVVGVGSVGTRAWIALLLGRDPNDPLFLQMKQAEASVLEEHLGPSEFDNHGQRVVTGGKLCGWTLARPHARTGDRVAIAAYLGSGFGFDRAILEFSNAYAKQNERDYQQLVAAVKSDTVTAQVGL